MNSPKNKRSSYNKSWAKRQRLHRAANRELEKHSLRQGEYCSAGEESFIDVDVDVDKRPRESTWSEVESDFDISGDDWNLAVDNDLAEEVQGIEDENISERCSSFEQEYDFDPDEYLQQYFSELRLDDESADAVNETVNEKSASYVLAKWARENDVTHTAVDNLLKCCHEIDPSTLASLPLTARTLFKTCQLPIQTKMVSDMEYVNLGVKKSLVQHLSRYPVEIREQWHIIEISLNIDGLPLFHSSKKGVWPVLCAVNLNPITVFPLSISFGPTKPSNLDFLRETIAELKDVLQEGIDIDEKHIELKLRCVVCDAPARALVRATKNHNSYFGCERCTQKGVWVRKAGGKGGRVTFQETDDIEARTDMNFRARTHEMHHQGATPFQELAIDLVHDFAIDYMHQICLGVVRRLLITWFRGPQKERILSRESMERIDGRLIQMRASMPCDFARKPRSTDELEHWKATEYRQFVLYTGVHVLQGVLDAGCYKNFLALSVACMILVSPTLANTHAQYAKTLLKYFIQTARTLYGPHFLVYNVHMMLHIADDASRFGCLDKCSGFPFENYLYKMKRMVRSGKRPLIQLVRRLQEHSDGKQSPTVTGSKLSSKPPDNAFILDEQTCVTVQSRLNAQGEDGGRQVMCSVYRDARPLFMEPCPSTMVGIYFFKRSGRSPLFRTEIIPEAGLKRKAIKIDHEEGVVFQSILHDTAN